MSLSQGPFAQIPAGETAPTKPLLIIADQLKKLSYREMHSFAEILSDYLSREDGCRAVDIAEALLSVADTLEATL